MAAADAAGARSADDDRGSGRRGDRAGASGRAVDRARAGRRALAHRPRRARHAGAGIHRRRPAHRSRPVAPRAARSRRGRRCASRSTPPARASTRPGGRSRACAGRRSRTTRSPRRSPRCRAGSPPTPACASAWTSPRPARLPADVESELFRIASEALTNVRKHARRARGVAPARRRSAGRLRLTVTDAGRRVPHAGRARPRVRPVGIEDRARAVGGRAAIRSAPGRGTTVTVTVPITSSGRKPPNDGPAGRTLTRLRSSSSTIIRSSARASRRCSSASATSTSSARPAPSAKVFDWRRRSIRTSSSWISSCRTPMPSTASRASPAGAAASSSSRPTTRDDDVFRAIRGGARGYLLKGSPAAEIAQAIRQVHAGESYLSPRIAAKLVKGVAQPRGRTGLLSARERGVLRLVAAGQSNRQIAETLSISERTVKFHVTAIFNKLGADNRAQAVAIAAERGLLSRSLDHVVTAENARARRGSLRRICFSARSAVSAVKHFLRHLSVRTGRSCPDGRRPASPRPLPSPSGQGVRSMTHHVDTDSSTRLDGVRVAITGGTSGLGLALVREFLRRGARVAFVARTAERVERSRARAPGRLRHRRRRRAEGRHLSDRLADRRQPGRPRRAREQRVQPRTGAARAAGGHGVRRPRTGAGDQRARAVSTDQGAAGRAGRVGARRPRQRRAQRVERRRGQRVSAVGRVRREQSRARIT